MYLIAMEQILLGAKLQRIKLYRKLGVDSLPHATNLTCCDSEVSDNEWDIIDDVSEKVY